MTDENEFSFLSKDPVTNELVKLTFDTYDDMVKAKRKRNAEVLVSSGLLAAANALKQSSTGKTSASQRGIASSKRKAPARLPPRKSSRLRGIAADGHSIDLDARGRILVVNKGVNGDVVVKPDDAGVLVEKEGFFRDRVNDGSALSVEDAIGLLDAKWAEAASVRRSKKFLTRVSKEGLGIMMNKMNSPSSVAEIGEDNIDGEPETFIDQLNGLTIDDDSNVAKVCPDRIYAMACHPSTSSLIVCAGDKQGYLGIWDVDDTRENSNNGVYLFRPHTRPITHLEWNSTGSSLMSVSYDGSVRMLDVESQSFVESFATYDDSVKYKDKAGFGIDQGYRFWVQHGILDKRNEKCMFLATSIGSVLHIDTRIGTDKSSITFNQLGISDKKINSVDLHRNGHTLATCGLDNTVKLWDVRKFNSSKRKSSPSNRVAYKQCTKSVSSAFFSPSGTKLLATTMANTLELINVSQSVKYEFVHVVKMLSLRDL